MHRLGRNAPAGRPARLDGARLEHLAVLHAAHACLVGETRDCQLALELLALGRQAAPWSAPMLYATAIALQLAWSNSTKYALVQPDLLDDALVVAQDAWVLTRRTLWTHTHTHTHKKASRRFFLLYTRVSARSVRRLLSLSLSLSLSLDPPRGGRDGTLEKRHLAPTGVA